MHDAVKRDPYSVYILRLGNICPSTSFLLFRLTTRVYTPVLRTANKGKKCKKKGGNDEVLMERVGDYY